MSKLRVVTLNTWKGDGAYRARVSAMTEQLQALAPDIVALQEAFATTDGALSTSRTLAEVLGMDHVAYAMREKMRNVEGVAAPSTSGLCVLSRWPLRDTMARTLPSDERDGERGALFVAVEAPLGMVRLVNTHLTHLRDADALREEELRLVLTEPWLREPATIRLLCGDLNSEPDSETIRSMRRVGKWHIVDACGIASRRAPTMSHRNTNLNGEARDRAIDYICSLAPTAAAQPRVIGGVTIDQPSDDVFPSDHFGVFADISLAR